MKLRDLGWIALWRCERCEREFWQRPELVSQPPVECVTCVREAEGSAF